MEDTGNLGNKEVIDVKLLNAAKNGYLVIFVEEARKNELENGSSEEYFLRQTLDDKENILHLAIQYKQLEFIEKVVKGELLARAVTDELIKQQDKDGNTPLHVAAEVGNIDIFKLLFKYQEGQQEVPAGQGFCMLNKDGNTPLHLALINGKDEIATFLVELYPNLARVGKNNDGNTPLHVAAEVGNIECFKLLLEYDHKQAKVTNSDGNTPLHVAVLNVRVEIATLLLEHNHHLQLARAVNNLNETPLHLAIKRYKEIISLWNMFTYDEQGLDTYVASSLANETEKMNTLTDLLLKVDKSVASMHDNDNMTPLHRAGFLVTGFGVKVVKFILGHCPDSATEKDNYGQTILHYMVDGITSYKTGKDLLQLPAIDALRNSKDNFGDTPLDRAWRMNIKMVRALLDSASHQNVHDFASHQNVHDFASTNVVVQKINDFEMIRKRKKTMEEYGVVDGVHLQFLKSKLSKFGNDFLFSRDSKGRNLLHNLMQLERGSPIIEKEFYDFILLVADSHPKLVCQTDFNRETPIHILMRNSLNTKIRVNTDDQRVKTLEKSSLVSDLLNLCCKYYHIAKEASGKGKFKYDAPWLVQNVDGNTPLHEAFKANHFSSVWQTLSRLETNITAKFSNKHKETPLHLLAGSSSVEWPKLVIMDLVEANTEVALSRDENGLTPMMRAVQVGNITTFKILDDLYFQLDNRMAENNNNNNNNITQLDKDIKSAITEYLDKEKAREKDEEYPEEKVQYLAKKLLTDDNDHTLWHMLLKQPAYITKKLIEDIENKPHLIDLLKEGDKEGKTPLHLALEDRQFKHAHYFLKCSCNKELDIMQKLLDEKDGDGITPGDQLASFTDLPRKLEDLLSSPELTGYRSMFGISTTEMKDYVNTMGVIAALLATITFTSAFTVPGGVIQENKDEKLIGTPLLVNAVAFQAFMFFDISSMCLSTMVLFCLLWILAAGDNRKSVMLMDFSIMLLLISFYTTLLTFMAGVYATTIHVKPWIAIYTLVLCSLLMLLMRKHLVVRFLAPCSHNFFSHLGTRTRKWMKRVCSKLLSRKESQE